MSALVLKMSVSLDGYVAPIDGSTDWIAAGGSDDALSWTVETVSNAGAHLMGGHHLRGDGHPLARRLRAVRQADERDPQGRVLALARVRRLGRDDDRRRRPGRSHHAAQAGALRRISACPRRGTVRAIAGRDRLDRRVPPCCP